MSELKVEMVDSSNIVFAMMKDAGVRSFVVSSSGVELFLKDMCETINDQKVSAIATAAHR